MTQEEMDLIAGRTCRQYRDALNELGAIRAKCLDICGSLNNAKRVLDLAVLKDASECEGVATEELYSISCPSPEEVQSVLDDLLEARKKIATLRKHLEDMGYPPPK